MKLRQALLLAFVLGLGGFTAEAFTTNLLVTAEMSPYSLVATNNALAQVVGKKDGNILVAAADITLKFTLPETISEGSANTQISAPGKTLTLDLTGLGEKPFYYVGHLVAQKLIVKGRDNLVFGSETFYDALSAFEVPEIEFQDAEGEPIASPSGITFKCANLIAIPSTCPVTVQPGRAVALFGQAILEKANVMNGKFIAADGMFPVDTFDVWMLQPGSISVNRKIVVSAKRSLILYPRTLNTSSAFYAWWGFSNSNFAFPNDVELAEGATFRNRQHYFSTVTGKFTGEGLFAAAPNNGKLNNNGYQMILSPDFSAFEGSVEVTAADYPLTVSNSTTFLTRPLKLVGASQLKIRADSANDVTLPSLVQTGVGPAQITLAKNGRLTVGTVSGLVRFSGTDAATTAVIVNALADGASVMQGNGVSLTINEDPASLLRFSSAGSAMWLKLGASATDLDFATLPLDATRSYEVEPRSGVQFRNVPENMRLVVKEDGAAASVRGSVADLQMSGGAVTVEGDMSWTNQVAAWFDASAAGTLEQHVFAGVPRYYKDNRQQDMQNLPLIVKWHDRRPGQTDILLYNNRDTTDNPPAYHEGVFPYAIPYEKDASMTVLCCADLPSGSSLRRIYGCIGGKVKAPNPAMVVMVFGSAAGGGQALLPNSGGVFGRPAPASGGYTKDVPIMASSKYPVWVDGESVDPTTTGLSGDWQVVTIDTNWADVPGLGYKQVNWQDAGGQQYAEVLFFSNKLDNVSRAKVEWYLAKKWKLTDTYRAGPAAETVRAFGSGTVTLAVDARLDGAFSGTVNLGGNRLTLADKAMPPTDADLPGVDKGRIGWYDPDWRGTVPGRAEPGAAYVNTTSKFNDPYLCQRLYDREIGAGDGKPYLQSSGNGRAPAIRELAKSFGPARYWLDYSTWYAPDNNKQGRAMRFTNQPKTDTTLNALTNVRSVYLVQDSVQGGGTPFLDSMGGSKLSQRLLNGEPADPSVPVWRDASSASAKVFAGGHTYLDGREIDGTVQGFGGRPELLTAVGEKAFTLGVFGSYQRLDGLAVAVYEGEMQGEILIYDTELGDADRDIVQSYLMYKWFGTLPWGSGYANLSNVTVTGSGTLDVPNLAQMPRLGEEFAGTVNLPQATYAFTLKADQTVEGALVAPDATFVVPAGSTVKISAEGNVKAGDYVLIDAKDVQFGGVPQYDVPADLAERLTSRVEGGKIILTVKGKGMFLIFR